MTVSRKRGFAAMNREHQYAIASKGELTFYRRLGDTICGNYKATLSVLLVFAVST